MRRRFDKDSRRLVFRHGRLVQRHRCRFRIAGDAVRELDDVGFVVVPGPVAPPQLSRLRAVYDAAVSAADPADFNSGRTTTRVSDFVNRAPDFDGLYVYQPILEACCHVIGAPFHLSTMHARAVNPADARRTSTRTTGARRTAGRWWGSSSWWTSLRRDNGATRFVPGSQRWGHAPSDVMQDATADYEGQVSACGPAGSVVIYNGSVWHGHGANQTKEPRRSIQGAYIRRGDKQGTNQRARMRPETFARIGSLAKYVLNIEWTRLPVPDARRA